MGGQPKKKGGRVTPKGGRSDGRMMPAEKAGLESVFALILSSAPEDLGDDLPAITVEMWASRLWSIWHRSELVGMDAEAVFDGGLIAYAAGRTTPSAMAVLRGLETVAPEPYTGPRHAERATVWPLSVCPNRCGQGSWAEPPRPWLGCPTTR